MSLLVPSELVRTDTQLLNLKRDNVVYWKSKRKIKDDLNIVNTRFIFNSSITVLTQETK